MNNFDVCQGKWREYDVRVTLQSGEYKGNFVYQIRGNTSPLCALLSIDPTYDDIYPVKNNCCYEESEDDDENYWFKAFLKNKKGDILYIEDMCDYLENYIVAVEIIDCRECKV